MSKLVQTNGRFLGRIRASLAILVIAMMAGTTLMSVAAQAASNPAGNQTQAMEKAKAVKDTTDQSSTTALKEAKKNPDLLSVTGEVTNITSSTITVTGWAKHGHDRWREDRRFTFSLDEETIVLRKGLGRGTIKEVSVGDEVQVWAAVDQWADVETDLNQGASSNSNPMEVNSGRTLGRAVIIWDKGIWMTQVRGTITQINSGDQSFTLMVMIRRVGYTTSVKTDSNTDFVWRRGGPAGFDDLKVGQTVKVRGAWSDQDHMIRATRVEIGDLSGGNSNGNGNGNHNGNHNGNFNSNTNGNSNGNHNGNSNSNTNSNHNGNHNGNFNSNTNGNSNGNTNTGNVRPRAVIVSPDKKFRFKNGEEITLTGACLDRSKQPLPNCTFSWEVKKTNKTTSETVLGPTSPSLNPSTTFTPTLTTGDGTRTRYVITLTVQNGSLSDKDSRILKPQTVKLKFVTEPKGLRLELNGLELKSNITLTTIAGTEHAIEALSPQERRGVTYTFSSWSDGGAQAHSIIAPNEKKTVYTATYTASGPSTNSNGNSNQNSTATTTPGGGSPILTP